MANIETYTGGYFHYDDPQPEQINVTDIARALSMVCRFAGHVSTFYSVAEHAVLVHRLVKEAGGTWQEAFAALHHDSHEAYLGDVPTPLKQELGTVYKDLRVKADEAVAARFKLSTAEFHSEAVREADEMALRIEASVLKRSTGLGDHWGYDIRVDVPAWIWRLGWVPTHAEDEFLRAHYATLYANSRERNAA